jgi:membrane protein
LNTIAPAAPPAAMKLIESVLHDIVYVENAPGLLSIGAVLALWSGSNIFAALADALNRVAGVRETRPFWKIIPLAMAFVIAAGIAAAVATSALLFGGTIVDSLANELNLQTAARLAWLVSQTGVVILLIIGLGTAVFHFLPSQRLAWREAFIGSSVATVLWLIVTVGFRIYLQHFPNYNEAYGAIGAVIVLLTWMYLSMLSLITGGQLAAELHRERVNPSVITRIEAAASLARR